MLYSKVHIPYVSSKGSKNAEVERNIQFLRDGGLTVVSHPPKKVDGWKYTAGAIEYRSRILNLALLDTDSKFVLCARGGYGASDLLEYIPFNKLKLSRNEKIITGFSDVSAIQCAVYAKLGWRSLHAPMPASVLWKRGGNQRDVNSLLSIMQGHRCSETLRLEEGYKALGSSKEITGRLFGGCLAVITNLIGTEYFPKSLSDHILFLEDIDENPAQVIRYLNQWKMSGSLKGVKALVFGNMVDCYSKDCTEAQFLKEARRRFGIPVFVSHDFGHVSPNIPLMIGAKCSVFGNELRWSGL
jgi:muramoyltetrapeptide carboxypeptidase